MTVLLSRSDLESLLDVAACLDALEEGFRARPVDIPPQRVRTDLPGPGTATALIPGLIDGIPAYTVKVNAKFPQASPALRGVVCLHDLGTGELLAVLDSATVTAWRTGLAAALGTHVLARPDAARFVVVGAGAQADLVVRGLGALRSVADLRVYDVDGTRADRFATRHGGRAVASLDVEKADVVVLATWSRTPLLGLGDVSPGTHLTSLGADEPGKAELGPDLLRAARVIVDDVALVVAMGALGTAGLGASAAVGTLSQVFDGSLAARAGSGEISVYSPVGLPWQDLALAWLAYQRAHAAGIGQAFDFLG